MYRLLILIGFAVTSCAPAYVSNSRNTPMFEQRNQFAAGASMSTSGADLQLAYAVTNHIAVIANGIALKRDVVLNSDRYSDSASFTVDYERTHLFGEAGIGYFSKPAPVQFEIFAGYGLGKVNSYEKTVIIGSDAIVRGVYNRTFIQPSICICERPFEFIITSRISAVGFRNYMSEDITTGQIVNRATKGAFQWFFEPSVTGRARIAHNFHIYMQVGLNGPMNGSYYYDHNYFQMIFGLQFRTGPKHDN